MDNALFPWEENPRFSVVQRIEDYLNAQQKTYDEALADTISKSMSYHVIRQLMKTREPKPGQLRGSDPGPCARKMAYKFHGVPEDGKKIDARGQITFLMGDVLEVMVVALMKLAGIQTEGTVLDEGQIDLEFDAGDGITVPGHADGFLPVQEGLSKRTLLEVKSTSDWAFKNKFEKGIIDSGYTLQHNVYFDATGLEQGIFIAVNKNTGHICEVWTKPSGESVLLAKSNYHLVSASSLDDMPPRYFDGDAYGLKLNKKKDAYTRQLAPLCTYCSHYNLCWNKPVISFDRYSKPVLTVTDLPRDLELDLPVEDNE